MIGDFFRFWWALLQLNARQSAFRFRRGRGRCPCQAPSDSGAAWVTHCEESLGWNRPERLRFVCPHLRRGDDGWRCSVNAAAVRPHWLRAAGYFAALGLSLYVLAATATFGLLRAQGFATLSPLDTLSPARWSRIAAARSTYFLAQAHASLAQGDVRATRVALASAATSARGNYEILLAVAQATSYLSEDQPAATAFRALLETFPQHRARTSVAFHDAMVALRAFDALGELASTELAQPGATEVSGWLRALFVAVRGSARPQALLARHNATLAALPPLWRNALAAEAELRAGQSDAYTRLVGLPVIAAEAPLLTTIAETLADRAPMTVAIDEIIRLAPAIGAFERERLLFRLHAVHRADVAALRAFDAMLRAANQPAQRERLLATLVEFPDVTRLRRLTSAVSNPQTPFTAHELGALWVAATLSAEPAVRQLAEDRLTAHNQAALAPGLTTQFSPVNTSLWMRTLPMGRETAWALALKFAPGRRELATR